MPWLDRGRAALYSNSVQDCQLPLMHSRRRHQAQNTRNGAGGISPAPERFPLPVPSSAGIPAAYEAVCAICHRPAEHPACTHVEVEQRSGLVLIPRADAEALEGDWRPVALPAPGEANAEATAH